MCRFEKPAESASGSAAAPVRFYVAECAAMAARESTTLYIDLTHVFDSSQPIHDMLVHNYYRYEHALNQCLLEYVREHHRDHPKLIDSQHAFNIAFHNVQGAVYMCCCSVTV